MIKLFLVILILGLSACNSQEQKDIAAVAQDGVSLAEDIVKDKIAPGA